MDFKFDSSMIDPIPLDAVNDMMLQNTLTLEGEGVSGIFEYMENILKADDLNPQFSPTPIGPDGVQGIVEEVNTQGKRGHLLSILETRKINKASFSPRKKLKTSVSAYSRSDREAQPLAACCSSSSIIADQSNSNFPDFSFSLQSDKWNQRFQDLLKFHQAHGHCLVPNNWKEDIRLAQWVKRQRYNYKLKKNRLRTKLTRAREDALEKVDFVWEPQAVRWEEMLNEMREYKKIYGTCNVPSTCTVYPSLALWVKSQRRQYRNFVRGKQSNLSSKRIEKLDALGFIWNPRCLKLQN